MNPKWLRLFLIAFLSFSIIQVFVTTPVVAQTYDRCVDVPADSDDDEGENDCLHYSNHGTYGGFEVGALIYRAGTGLNKYNHTGIFYRLLPGMDEPWIIHMAAEPSLAYPQEGQITAAPFVGDPDIDFLGGRCYYGAYYPTQLYSEGSIIGYRDQIIDLAFALMQQEPSIGYPGYIVPGDAITCLSEINCDDSVADDGIITPDEVENLRCDGFTEYVYEYGDSGDAGTKEAIRLWNSCDGPEWSIAKAPELHNDMPGNGFGICFYEPEEEFAPLGQRGAAGLTQTTARPVQIDYPEVTSWAQDGTPETTIRISFSERMYPTDLNDHQIILRDSNTLQEYSYSHKYIEGTDCSVADAPFGVIGPLTICITPSMPLPDTTMVEVLINAGTVRDAAGNAFQSTWSRLFTVGADPDDLDGDGVPDSEDNCLNISNHLQEDQDGDFVGDLCDNCPQHWNASQLDSDVDELGDPCDSCPNDALNDTDGDGWCSDLDNCPDLSNPYQEDVDKDGIGDACNCGTCYSHTIVAWLASEITLECDYPPDGSGNAWPDVSFDDASWNSMILPDGWSGTDNDRYYRGYFQSDSVNQHYHLSFSSNDGIEIYVNGAYATGIGECHGGGCVNNPIDCYVNVTVPALDITPWTVIGSNVIAVHVTNGPDGATYDASLQMSVENDTDGDCIVDTEDNCPNFCNENQLDADDDGAGDVCDLCPLILTPQIDSDGDGVGDACDTCPLRFSPEQYIKTTKKILDPESYTSDLLGSAVAGLGDLNGDGIPEYAASQPLDDAAGTNTGSILVFSGVDHTMLCRLTDPDPGRDDYYADVSSSRLLTGIPDVTGDGVADIVVGAYRDNTTQGDDSGSVLVYSGSECATSGSPFIRKILDLGDAGNNLLGTTVSWIHDLNGDGYPEILAGSHGYDSVDKGSNEGSVLVFSGDDGTELYRLRDPEGSAGNQLGYSVLGIPDISGDGIPDIVAGAWLDDVGSVTNAGTLALFSGVDGSFLWRLTDPMANADLRLGGGQLAVMDDLDGDGYPEILAGSNLDDTMGGNAGAVLIFSGHPELNGNGDPIYPLLARLTDPLSSAGDYLGASLAVSQDINGDGVAEVVAGAPYDDTPAVNAGSVVVFSGGDGKVIYRLTDDAGESEDRLGTSVAVVGDLSGDGVPEIVAGSYLDDERGLLNVGSVLIVSFESDCDGDGYGVYGGDCDDNNASRYPGAFDFCDGIDNDCDGLSDPDNDLDGYTACQEEICDPADDPDENPWIYPGAPERCNGMDDDCDGEIDEGEDLDLDGYQTPCDCDDTNDQIHPLGTEICNRLDDNCDGQVDEGSASLTSTYKVTDSESLQGDWFGYAMAPLGDINGDGIGDLAVMQPLDDTVGANTGSVLVYSGSDRSLLCRLTDDDLGGNDYYDGSASSYKMLTGIPDITGDGVADIVVGAFRDNTIRGTDSGSVVVYSGGACAAGTNAYVRKILDPNGLAVDLLGESVSWVSDLTGDGIPEIIAGARATDFEKGNDEGSVLVFSGADGSLVYELRDPEGSAGNNLGYSVLGIDDISGDGIPDIVAGSWRDEPDDNNSGWDAGSLVVFSGADGSFVRRMTEPSPDNLTDDYLGEGQLASVADLDGDGYPEILAGVPRDNTALGDTGSVMVFSGNTGELLMKLTDPAGATGDWLGTTVAAVDDLNGDGVPEVLAGAQLHDLAGTNAGAAVVFSLNDGSVLYRLTDPNALAHDYLGLAVAVIGDLSGDGVPELVAGAYRDDERGLIDVGSITIFSLESDCDGDGFGIYGGDCADENSSQYPGAVDVCDALDNDCDGTPDEDSDGDGHAVCDECDDGNPSIYPGAPELCNAIDDDCDTIPDNGVDLDGDGYETPCDCDDDNYDVNPGAIEVCDHVDNNCDGQVDEGSASLTSTYKVTDSESLQSDWLGYAMAPLGDINGDGIGDLAVMQPLDDTVGANTGSVLVYSGSDRSLLCRLTDDDLGGNDYYDGSASSYKMLTGIPDITGDGVADIVVGAFRDNTIRGTDSGSVVVYSGGACAAGTNAYVRKILDPNGLAVDLLGESVSWVSDLTGDGIPEIIAGARATDFEKGNDEGSVLVFSGADGSLVYELRDPEGSAGNNLGYSVLGIDDISGDGIPDIVAGSWRDEPDDNNSGWDAGSLVVFSGADGSFVRRMTEPSPDNLTDDYLGEGQLASVADLDGDGYPEILAGVPRDNTALGDTGSVMVFSGNTGELLMKLTDPAGATGDWLGTTVAAVDDLNGDGVPEVLAGAQLHDLAGTNAGAAVVFSLNDGSVLYRLTDPNALAHDYLGLAVAVIGDLSGDGVPELVAGAYRDDERGLIDVGSITIFSLESDCDGDGFGIYGGDCADENSSQYPGAVDVCDALDNDCDGTPDEDSDGDGHAVCDECDDGNPSIYPGAPELCNAIDDDCDTIPDNGVDLDGDGYETPCDCDDDNYDVNPGAIEVCDHVDNNCDGQVDEGSASLTSTYKVTDSESLQGDWFGYAMAPLGDINGDGIGDLAVMQPLDDTVGANTGSVLVYSGSDRSLLCRLTDDDFGGSDYYDGSASSYKMLTGIPDITGDGVADIVVGAFRDNTIRGTDSGSVVVYSGGACAAGTNAYVRKILDPNGLAVDLLGESVSWVSDLTGDGIPEIIAGARATDFEKGNDEGSVLVFSGADGSLVYELRDPEGSAGNNLGYSVLGIDDISGDGIPDIVAGSWRDEPDDNNSGWDAGSLVVFSGADGSFVRRMTEPSPDNLTDDYLGEGQLASVADLDGDGYPEILAGVPRDNTALGDTGSVMVFSGNTGELLMKLTDPAGATGDWLGTTVAAVDDLNGDGVPEVLAGAQLHDLAGTNAGAAVVFSLNDGSVLYRLTDPNALAHDYLGLAVAVIGDLSGDGVPELVAGAYRDDERGLIDVGSITIFSLESDCDGDGFGIYGGDCADENSSQYPGAVDVCDALDNDCDGTPDEDSDGDGHAVCDECDDGNPSIYPGAPELCNAIDDDCDTIPDNGVDLDGDGYETPCDCDDDNYDVNPGAIEVCDHVDNNCDGQVDEGSASLTSTYKVTDSESLQGDWFGYAMAPLGDINGDGIGDLAVMQPLDDTVGANTGSVLVYSGSDRSLLCRLTDDDFGGSDYYDGSASSYKMLTGIPDITGDGVADIVVGAFRDNTIRGTDSGSVVVYSGGACAAGTNAYVRKILDPNGLAVDLLGESVSWVSDLTGDGIPEIIAGARATDFEKGNDEGSVLVFSGADGSLVYELRDPEGSAGNNLGYSVLGIDDISGDGIPDIVAGSWRDEPDDNNSGWDAGSLVVFSGADGSFVRRMTEPSPDNLTDDYLGEGQLASVADLDGDGYPEILAGVPRDNTALGDTGSVMVFSGNTGELLMKLTDPAGATGDWLGTTVAAVDDLNGDGVPEVLAGAQLHDLAGTNAGAAVVFSLNDGSVLYRLTDPNALAHDYLGLAVAVIGDLSGDGVPELVAGAYRDDERGLIDVGSITIFSLESDCDGDGFGIYGGDCADENSSQYPGAVDVCDALDNDCDGTPDEDSDGDGHAVCDECDDGNPSIYPGAPELCNAIDDDCDTIPDNGVDLDGDGYETPCDCDDDNYDVNPGAIEVCDHVDNNCDGQVDEGSASLTSTYKVTDSESLQSDWLGYAMAPLGDINGDGIGDLAVMQPLDDTVGANTGSVLVYSGSDRSLLCRLTDDDLGGNDYYDGSASSYKMLTGIPDITGDGVADIVVGAFRDNTIRGTDSGSVVVYSGGACAAGTNAYVRKILDPNGLAVDVLGESVSWVSDLTGDGIPEIIAGARATDSEKGNDEGSVLVFSGADGSLVYELRDPEGSPYNQLGYSVLGIDDISGDGIPDIVAGAYDDEPDDNNSGWDAGSLVVFSGADGSFVRRMTEPSPDNQTDDYLGEGQLASVADLDGDGYPEILAGVPHDNTAQGGDAGSVMVFSGHTGALLMKLTDPAGATSDWLGTTVAVVDDLNGDGVPEVLAGAQLHDVAGTNAGAAVVFSLNDGSVLYRLTDPNALANDYFGIAVAVIGDLSGDGVPELVVGAYRDDERGLIDVGSITIFSLESDCDGDGFGIYGGDCADDDFARNPDAIEVCADGIDNDCDTLLDCDDPEGCAPQDTVPDEIQNVQWPDNVTITWDPDPLADRYDVFRGTISDLILDQDFRSGTCFADEEPNTQVIDGENPSLNEGFYYLVRGIVGTPDECRRGTYGSLLRDSTGRACP